MGYSDLTPTQKIIVAWLYADQYFHSRAGDFDYEVDARGEINGRTELTPCNAKVTRCVSSDTRVTMNAETQITSQQSGRAKAAIDSLARVIARNLYSKVEEHVHA